MRACEVSCRVVVIVKAKVAYMNNIMNSQITHILLCELPQNTLPVDT